MMPKLIYALFVIGIWIQVYTLRDSTLDEILNKYLKNVEGTISRSDLKSMFIELIDKKEEIDYEEVDEKWKESLDNYRENAKKVINEYFDTLGDTINITEFLEIVQSGTFSSKLAELATKYEKSKYPWSDL